MKIRLVSVGGDLKATEISLQLPAVVGRGRGAQLDVAPPVDQPATLRAVTRPADSLMVRDLGSLNGPTWEING